MLLFLFIAIVLEDALYISVFNMLPRSVKGFLIRHKMLLLAVTLMTMPIELMIYGAGLYAGIINFASSGIFVWFVAGYGAMHPDLKRKRIRVRRAVTR